MYRTNMYKDFKALLKKLELPDIRFHDLRHTAATLMLQQGIHPKIVQERLGHSDISMTLNIYSHVLPSMQEEAAEKLDELLRPIEVGNEFKKIDENHQSNLKSSGKMKNGSCSKKGSSCLKTLFCPKIRTFWHFMPVFVAGDNGFEPLLTVPETAVLPLDESPILFQRAVLYHAHRG